MSQRQAHSRLQEVHKPHRAKVITLRADWHRYEQLKRLYTRSATTPAEYDAGIRRAVRESGV